ncbi:MAG: efflux RND transporter periplasmic adaptor subunit [Planctomycetota bacterium]|nr:efflux RND transporter periplasmic adaptor subunit [Planctomycetota bacterium]
MTQYFKLLAFTALVSFALGGCGPSNSSDDAPEADTHDHGADDGQDHGEEGQSNALDAEAGHTEDDGHDHGEEGQSHDPDAEAGHTEDDGHDHADHEGEEEMVIQLDAHELAEFGIQLEIAQSGTLVESTSLAGEIVLNPDRIAHVVSRADGIGLEVLRTIGDRVEAGEILAILESPALAESKADYFSKAAQAALASTDLARAETIHVNTNKLLEIIALNPDLSTLQSEISGLDIGANRSNLITAYAELRAAEVAYHREKNLFDRQNTSTSEFLHAESELGKALATFQSVRDDLSFSNQRGLDLARRTNLVTQVSLQAAERRLHALGLDENEVDQVEDELDDHLARYEIRAPLGGLIIERHLVRGESIQAGEQVFVIADLSSVWGQLTLYQRDLAHVYEGQMAQVLGTHNLETTTVKIEYISPILDEQTRTTTARVELDNSEGHWRPGMFIRAELIASEQDASVLVPRSALQEIDGETVVFVETAKGLERRDVRVGRLDANSAEIISGLRPGERYVARGGLALKVELNKAALEHAGHAH